LFIILGVVVKPSVNVMYKVQPLVLSANIFLLVVFFLFSYSHIKKQLEIVPKWAKLALIVTLLIGLSLRLVVTPWLHKIYYDEDIYINIAHNIANQGQACLCDYGSPSFCKVCIDNKQPMGMATFYAILIKLFGWAGYGSEASIFATSIILSSIAILLIFVIAYQLTKNPYIGLFAALFLALTPTHIRWSASTSLDSFYLTFLLLACVAWLIDVKDFNSTMFAFFATAFAVQIRPEGLITILILGFLVLATHKKPFELLTRKEFLLGLLLMLLLVLPTVWHLKLNKEETWGAPQGKKISLSYFPGNAKDNILFFFDATRFPIVVTAFAVLGFFYGLAKFTKQSLALMAWFLVFFMVWAVFYAGSFNYGMDIRFMLTLLAPVLIFAATGCCIVMDLVRYVVVRFNKRSKLKLNIPLFTLIAAGICLWLIIDYYDYISNFGEKASDAMTVHEFARAFVQNTSSNCIFLSQVSSMFLNFNRPSIQMHQFIWGSYDKEVLNNYDCIYLYWGYWCASHEPHRIEQCAPLLNKFSWNKVASLQFDQRREFAFYKLKKQQ